MKKLSFNIEETAAYIRNFGQINQAFIVENPEKVYELLKKSSKKFKKVGNTIWRTK